MNDCTTAPTAAAICAATTGRHLARVCGSVLDRLGVPLGKCLDGTLDWSAVAHDDLLKVAMFVACATDSTESNSVSLELRRAAAAIAGTWDAQETDAEILAGWLGGRA